MIPQVLHYCWFGGAPLGKLQERCMRSWEKYCPGYQIVRWDENNAPLSDNAYVRQAVVAGKWAFVSDYVRLKALWEHGGVYLDTDVELVRSLDGYLRLQGFMGFESMERTASCLIGVPAHHPLIGQLLRIYESVPFLKEDGDYDQTPNTERITQLLCEQGLHLDGGRQTVAGMEVFPQEVFSAKDMGTGKIRRTEQTVAIHHFVASWMSRRQRFHTRVAQLLGPEMTARVKRLLSREGP